MSNIYSNLSKIKPKNDDFSQSERKLNKKRHLQNKQPILLEQTVVENKLNDLELIKMKKKFTEELYLLQRENRGEEVILPKKDELNLNESIQHSNGAIDSNRKVINDYQVEFTKYIDNSFTERLVSIINNMIMLSLNNKDVRINYPIHKLIISVTKKFMLTEYELVYFSLYLDKFGWLNPDYYIEQNLNFCALTTKIYLNKNNNVIINFLNHIQPEFEKQHSIFLQEQRNKIENLNIPPKDVNERYNTLVKGYNIYCKQNYLDLNFVVDEILNMSIPYNETRKEKNGEASPNENNSVYNVSIIDIKNNYSVNPGEDFKNKKGRKKKLGEHEEKINIVSNYQNFSQPNPFTLQPQFSTLAVNNNNSGFMFHNDPLFNYNNFLSKGFDGKYINSGNININSCTVNNSNNLNFFGKDIYNEKFNPILNDLSKDKKENKKIENDHIINPIIHQTLNKKGSNYNNLDIELKNSNLNFELAYPSGKLDNVFFTKFNKNNNLNLENSVSDGFYKGNILNKDSNTF